MTCANSPTPNKPVPVTQIKAELDACSFEELPAFIARHVQDARKAVQALVSRATKSHDKQAAEHKRVLDMYDAMVSLGGHGIVIGVDEVGRGPLAGPLTVAAVALRENDPIWGINDSKQLKAEVREGLAEQIKTRALAWGIAHIPPEDIDSLGMSAALRKAMLAAIEATGVTPDSVLIDGVPLHIHPKETCIVKGDAKVACIAAASIVAKVTRDALMCQMDQVYPGYGFAQNKGYGSAEHIAAIARLGLSPIHRRSFCHNFALPAGWQDTDRQGC